MALGNTYLACSLMPACLRCRTLVDTTNVLPYELLLCAGPIGDCSVFLCLVVRTQILYFVFLLGYSSAPELLEPVL